MGGAKTESAWVWVRGIRSPVPEGWQAGALRQEPSVDLVGPDELGDPLDVQEPTSVSLDAPHSPLRPIQGAVGPVRAKRALGLPEGERPAAVEESGADEAGGVEARPTQVVGQPLPTRVEEVESHEWLMIQGVASPVDEGQPLTHDALAGEQEGYEAVLLARDPLRPEPSPRIARAGCEVTPTPKRQDLIADPSGRNARSVELLLDEYLALRRGRAQPPAGAGRVQMTVGGARPRPRQVRNRTVGGTPEGAVRRRHARKTLVAGARVTGEELFSLGGRERELPPGAQLAYAHIDAKGLGGGVDEISTLSLGS